MVDICGPLSARPPTPPKTVSRMLSEKDRMEDSPVTVQTPIESPFLANDSTGAPSSRQSKRVNFSPWPKYIKPPTFTNTKSKALVPSNEQKPIRSILKATNLPGPVSLTSVVSYTPETFAMLLESVTQQLAGESTSSRVDAYMQFFGALRAYEKVPTEEEIVRKLGLITLFIQRDISRDLAKGGPLDTNIVIQALKLSVVLVWHPQISPQLPDDFKLFLIEHSVSCLEDGKLPKSVLTHYLSVLSTQNFQARIMTNAKATRMLAMLNGLTDRVKGNAVISQRLMIYERIFEQSKQAFVSQSVLWMDHLISGLLHHIRDVRLKAIELGFNAYMVSGSSPTLSRTLRDIFDRPLDNKRKLATEICERMSRMMANPETGEHVPQIWGVITLLLRSKRFNIDHWQHFKDWVLVLQKCFNCSDPEIKSKAIGNWNRFVLVVNISETTSRSLLRMLIKPILSQFERKKHEKQHTQPSQLVVASYYNLLYYAFRPDASYNQFDIVWEEYIALPSSNIFASVPSLSDRLAQALSNMLWSSHPLKAWSDNRVNELKRIAAEELSPLDCKWVRLRIPAVLKVFEDILKSSVWSSEMDKSNIAIAWISLSNALAFASSKEITPSPESMQAVAHVLGLLQRLWNAGPSSLNAASDSSMDTFFERFRFLSTTMIFALGSIPFTEKLLLKTADSTYQTSNTPTHRHSRVNNNLDSPILHLLRLISDVSGISGPTASYSCLINDTVEAACHGRVSRGSRLDILRQCAELYPSENEFHFGVDNFAQIVWESTARLSADCLCSFPMESARVRDGSVSRDYENVVKILSAGLKFSDISLVWDRLINTFNRVLRTERGDRAIATTVLEPLATLMMRLNVHNIYLPASSLFNHSLSIPFTDLDDAENNGLSLPSGLVGLAHRLLVESYARLNPSESTGVAVFLESIISFLGSGIASFRSMLLEKLQGPLALYLRDVSHKLTVERGVESRVLTACRALSSAVLNILQTISPHDLPTLHRFEHIVCSGLGSSHISTAKIFGDFWISTFGAQESLQYPATISEALRNLEAQVNSHKPDPVPGASLQMNTSDFPHRNLKTERSNGDTQTNHIGPENGRSLLKDMSAKSRIAFILDASPQSSYSACLDSSPIARGSESAALALQSMRNPLAPQQALTGGAANDYTDRDGSTPSMSDKIETTRHSEVFSMIDNLRSSSPPTNAPRELGFMTPPPLHSLRNEESGAETPQTPTIPAIPGDNDDGFLGSSPTPAIRGRTPSVGSAMPPSLTTAGGDSVDLDLPSSPPELQLRSPPSRHKSTPDSSPDKDKFGKNKKKKNKPKRYKAAGKETASNDQTADNRGEMKPEIRAGQSLRSGLRSTADKVSAKSEVRPVQQAHETPRTVCNEGYGSAIGFAPGPENDKAKAGPEKTEKPHPERPDLAADSSSDDMDTQATSQLEHDLVSVADIDGGAAENEVTATSEPAPATRKRKRKEEANATAQFNKERRRSSRLSSTATPAAEVEDGETTRSKKQKVSALPNGLPSSLASSASKTRKYEIAAPIPTPFAKSAKHERGTKRDKDSAEPSESQKASQKRRSSRISGHAALDIPEDSLAPKKSPRPSSLWKQNKKRKDNKAEMPQPQAAAEAQKNEVPATQESLPDAQEENAESSITARGPEEHPEPRSSRQPQQNHSETELVQECESPKEPTDVQMTGMGTLEQAVPEPETTTNAIQNLENEQKVSRQTQTDPSPEPDPEPAPQPSQEIKITASLRNLLNQVKLAPFLDRNTIKEMDDLLFDLRVEMHEAMRRHRDALATTNQ